MQRAREVGVSQTLEEFDIFIKEIEKQDPRLLREVGDL